MTESKTQLARFTTVDPIRDGTNWLVYCNGDAVNFVDLFLGGRIRMKQFILERLQNEGLKN